MSGNTALRNEPQGFSPVKHTLLAIVKLDSSPKMHKLLSDSHHPFLPSSKVCQRPEDGITPGLTPDTLSFNFIKQAVYKLRNGSHGVSGAGEPPSSGPHTGPEDPCLTQSAGAGEPAQ